MTEDQGHIHAAMVAASRVKALGASSPTAFEGPRTKQSRATSGGCSDAMFVCVGLALVWSGLPHAPTPMTPDVQRPVATDVHSNCEDWADGISSVSASYTP